MAKAGALGNVELASFAPKPSRPIDSVGFIVNGHIVSKNVMVISWEFECLPSLPEEDMHYSTAERFAVHP